MSQVRNKRRMATGVVESGPRDKTISVTSVRMVQHPKYRKYLRRRSTFKVHDENQEARPGDVVEIMETRPISKTKQWRLVRIISRSAMGSEVTE